MNKKVAASLAVLGMSLTMGVHYGWTATAPAAQPGKIVFKTDPRRPPLVDRSTLPRTIVTTDGEWDDQNSMIRLLYYTNELDIEGLVYTSANHHWKGDGVHTLQHAKDAGILTSFSGERNQGNPPQESINQKTWRWTGATWIEDQVLNRYAAIWSNLIQHDPNYPTPADLWSKIAIGNIDFDSDMHADTEGSNLIKRAILDNDPRTLYVQAWGGTNSIARALKSIEDQYKSTPEWPAIQAKVSKKLVIPALGLQDATYNDYIAKAWPNVVLIRTTGAPGCTRDHPNYYYCSAEYWTPLKYGNGPLIQARTQFGDGTVHESEDLITTNGVHNWQPGLARDMATWRLYARALPPPYSGLPIPTPTPIAPNPAAGANAGRGGGAPAGGPGGAPAGAGGGGGGGLGGGPPNERLSFSGEGDSPTFMFLFDNGLRSRTDVTLGGWAGRYLPRPTNPADYTAQADVDPEGKIGAYRTQRWIAEIQNDFAGRIKWGVAKTYAEANHNPVVKVGADLTARPGQVVPVSATVTDPDGDKVALNWIVYKDASTVTSPVTLRNPTTRTATITVPADANSGQRIVLVLTATDDGYPYPMSKYGQVVVTVQ